MKRFTLLLITVILSLNCMAQSDNTVIMNLHKVEFTDSSLIELFSVMEKDKPRFYHKGKRLILDFYSPDLPVDQFFIVVKEYDMYYDGATDEFAFPKGLAYYTVINGCYYFLYPDVPKNLIKVLPAKKEFTYGELYEMPIVGGSYYGVFRKKGNQHYQILLNETIGE